MPYADWAAVTRDLTTTLERLDDREFLIMGESAPTTRPRRGLFARRSEPGPARYVQAVRVEDVLSAECVGAMSLGGTWEMDDGTIERLRSLGWLTAPECRVEFGAASPNFELYVGLESASGLAELMVTSLAVLGAAPGSLELECSREGGQQVG